MPFSGKFRGAPVPAATSPPGSASARVNEAFTVWDDTFDKGDAAALAALYAGDAYILPPTHTPVTGKAGIIAFFQQNFANGVTGHVLTPFDIADYGDELVANSTWKATAPDGKGGTQTVGGLATHVLMQQADGSLKLRVHTFN